MTPKTQTKLLNDFSPEQYKSIFHESFDLVPASQLWTANRSHGNSHPSHNHTFSRKIKAYIFVITGTSRFLDFRFVSNCDEVQIGIPYRFLLNTAWCFHQLKFEKIKCLNILQLKHDKKLTYKVRFHQMLTFLTNIRYLLIIVQLRKNILKNHLVILLFKLVLIYLFIYSFLI